MSDGDNSTSERRRREAVVKFGRQQIKMMEKERELETAKWKIQQFLGKNHDLESRLEEMERRNQEEQLDSGKEAARRQTVVKLWRLQVRLMERQRQLMRLERETEELLGLVKEIERKLEMWDSKVQTFERNMERMKLTPEKELWEIFRVENEPILEDYVSKSYELLAEVEVKMDHQPTVAILQEFAVDFQQIEEEVKTLR